MPSDRATADPVLTVIMPVYNAEKYLSKAIESVLCQTHTDFSLLIIDDGSCDNSLEIARRYEIDPRIKVISHSRNRGKLTVVNEAVEEVRTLYITIHDSDDISLPGRFEIQVNALIGNSFLGMCGTGFRSISDDGNRMDSVLMKSDYREIMANIDSTSQFHGPTMMIRKSVIDELGQFYRPYFSRTNEDTDLAYRIAQKYEVTNIPEILYLYRIHDASLCRRHLDAHSRNLYRLVVFLARERAEEKGCDSLDRGDYETIDNFMSRLLARYDTDSSFGASANTAVA